MFTVGAALSRGGRTKRPLASEVDSRLAAYERKLCRGTRAEGGRAGQGASGTPAGGGSASCDAKLPAATQ